MSETETVRQEAKSLHAAQGLAHVQVNANAYAAILATPWPSVMLGVSVHADVITTIDFLPRNTLPCKARDGIAREAVRQLQAYFRDPRYCFALPLEPIGTPFQHRVWDALRLIPAGMTLSYGELAQQLETSARAIGGACRANPIPLIIPCHRVVGAHGLGGFMGVTVGPGLELKERLLAHEFHSA